MYKDYKVKFNKIAVLTTKNSWFIPYAKKFIFILRNIGLKPRLFYNYADIPGDYEIVFMLCYSRLVNKKLLEKHRHNIVCHGSDLPKGRGWAPTFWQILEGRNKIPIVLFEASTGLDEGNIYLKSHITYDGHELYSEIREIQAKKAISLCLNFLNNYQKLTPRKQKGKATYYIKREPKDSQLNINKTIKDQFNLLRIVSNDDFPAFFYHKGHKYIIKIYKDL